jgi:hypothetical protein
MKSNQNKPSCEMKLFAAQAPLRRQWASRHPGNNKNQH